ncbi:YdcF family protein [Geomonas anaerohicana]|uniref:YdcF family protein n=1 Tax=Geomonas anaerohicana TaxID=2798583 RepID=A0ABS0YBZ6_9BACT|nr:YdcF family protein [Geomonas anaerohicana]MBJ6749838.1 YdcF family protein [Geomonas anaerohicana]
MKFARINIAAASLCCLLFFVVIPSFPRVRAVLAAPLCVTDAAAVGDACYVLAGGESVWERLNAAADLMHLGRVPCIYLMDDPSRDQYNVPEGRSWSRGKWYAGYLVWRGVPQERIRFVPKAAGFFGTRTEAANLASSLPPGVRRVVIVSSAPHMRRALLAFRRALPAAVAVTPYAATELASSQELYYPLWIEYLKLVVYSMIA